MTVEKTPAAAPSLDLAAILEAAPPKRSAVLDLARIDVGAFGVGEILALAEAVGVAPDELGPAMSLRAPAATRARIAVALAWLIARRREPELELADVETWALEVRGKPVPTPAAGRNGAGRSHRKSGARPPASGSSSDSGA